MNTRSCAHCGAEFTYKRSTKKYCKKSCCIMAYHQTDKGKKARKKHYLSVTAPRGQRLQERLDNLFRAQAAVDPSGLPQLASRVLSWRPKGFSEAVVYAFHPYGPLERDWLYYADYTPEEAVVVYERED